MLKKICLVAVLLGGIIRLQATHIVGMVIDYKCISVNAAETTYEVRLQVYKDRSGTPEFDDLVRLFVLDHETSQQVDSLFLEWDGNSRELTSENYICRTQLSNSLNIDVAYYTEQITLKDNKAGYRIIHQRCCRNGDIVNLRNGGNQGITAECVIFPSNGFCNSSPQYDTDPAYFYCMGDELEFDLSILPTDGDSMVYRLCAPYLGGDRFNNVTPSEPLPYTRVDYAFGYSETRPFGIGSVVAVDGQTGVLTGNINNTGRYVVGLCVEEYRNGAMISRTYRDFQLNVTNCAKRAVAAIVPPGTYCVGYEIDFENGSSVDGGLPGTTTYEWHFGDGISSANFQPSHVYDSARYYDIELSVKRGTCTDTTSAVVGIIEDEKPIAKFGYYPTDCNEINIQFIDSSVDGRRHKWTFGDGGFASSENPVHYFSEALDAPVALRVENQTRCFPGAPFNSDTFELVLDSFYKQVPHIADFVVDEDILAYESFQASAQSISQGLGYAWLLNDQLIGEQETVEHIIDERGEYTLCLHQTDANNCMDTLCKMITVKLEPHVALPNAFTPDGDGLNDILLPNGVGIANIDFKIFNRWNQLVFETTTLNTGWDGRFNGVMQESEVYVYAIIASLIDGQEVQLFGNVTLVR